MFAIDARRTVAAAALALTGLVGASGLAACQSEPAASNQEPADPHQEMVDRANEVMPFDLTATTHSFTKTDAGGVQEVVAHDPDDSDTVALIREHLAEEVDAFEEGDFSDPATIHGEDMAGLDVLTARADEFEVNYEDIEAGGRITYTASDPDLIDALHAWFDHQNADHSQPGMGG
jgi:hypothetical protein